MKNTRSPHFLFFVFFLFHLYAMHSSLDSWTSAGRFYSNKGRNRRRRWSREKIAIGPHYEMRRTQSVERALTPHSVRLIVYLMLAADRWVRRARTQVSRCIFRIGHLCPLAIRIRNDFFFVQSEDDRRRERNIAWLNAQLPCNKLKWRENVQIGGKLPQG